MFAVLMALGWPESTAAQPIERPTDCTEEMAVGTIFIGHDCGEWASVLISGNVIIRKPWSRANRASRAVRLRERREGSPVTAPPTSVPDRDPDPDPLDGPPPRDARNGNRGGTTEVDLEVELRCEATPEQTIITNNGDETAIVTEIRSLAGPPVAARRERPIPTSPSRRARRVSTRPALAPTPPAAASIARSTMTTASPKRERASSPARGRPSRYVARLDDQSLDANLPRVTAHFTAWT